MRYRPEELSAQLAVGRVEKSSFKDSWKRRYLELTRGQLIWHVAVPGSVRHRVALRPFQTMDLVDITNIRWKDCVILVKSPLVTLTFRVASEMEASCWARAIQEAMVETKQLQSYSRVGSTFFADNPVKAQLEEMEEKAKSSIEASTFSTAITTSNTNTNTSTSTSLPTEEEIKEDRLVDRLQNLILVDHKSIEYSAHLFFDSVAIIPQVQERIKRCKEMAKALLLWLDSNEGDGAVIQSEEGKPSSGLNKSEVLQGWLQVAMVRELTQTTSFDYYEQWSEEKGEKETNSTASDADGTVSESSVNNSYKSMSDVMMSIAERDSESPLNIEPSPSPSTPSPIGSTKRNSGLSAGPIFTRQSSVTYQVPPPALVAALGAGPGPGVGAGAGGGVSLPRSRPSLSISAKTGAGGAPPRRTSIAVGMPFRTDGPETIFLAAIVWNSAVRSQVLFPWLYPSIVTITNNPRNFIYPEQVPPPAQPLPAKANGASINKPKRLRWKNFTRFFKSKGSRRKSRNNFPPAPLPNIPLPPPRAGGGGGEVGAGDDDVSRSLAQREVQRNKVRNHLMDACISLLHLLQRESRLMGSPHPINGIITAIRNNALTEVDVADVLAIRRSFFNNKSKSHTESEVSSRRSSESETLTTSSIKILKNEDHLTGRDSNVSISSSTVGGSLKANRRKSSSMREAQKLLHMYGVYMTSCNALLFLRFISPALIRPDTWGVVHQGQLSPLLPLSAKFSASASASISTSTTASTTATAASGSKTSIAHKSKAWAAMVLFAHTVTTGHLQRLHDSAHSTKHHRKNPRSVEFIATTSALYDSLASEGSQGQEKFKSVSEHLTDVFQAPTPDPAQYPPLQKDLIMDREVVLALMELAKTLQHVSNISILRSEMAMRDFASETLLRQKVTLGLLHKESLDHHELGAEEEELIGRQIEGALVLRAFYEQVGGFSGGLDSI